MGLGLDEELELESADLCGVKLTLEDGGVHFMLDGASIQSATITSAEDRYAIARFFLRSLGKDFVKAAERILYEPPPCTCPPDCPHRPCKGKCGCEGCRQGYGDFLAAER